MRALEDPAAHKLLRPDRAQNARVVRMRLMEGRRKKMPSCHSKPPDGDTCTSLRWIERPDLLTKKRRACLHGVSWSE